MSKPEAAHDPRPAAVDGTGGSRAAAALQRLVGAAPCQGREYWRTLEELADSAAFRELVEREFPAQASEWADPVARREFLVLMGASLALAGFGGCSPAPAPPQKIVPYVRPPEQGVPGKPLFFATAMTLGGVASGILVESHTGRPTKIEGNPDHPASLGATDRFAQASVLGLYDPDRSQSVVYRGRVRSWGDAVVALRGALADQRGKRGAGLRVVTETVTSPTLARQIGALLDAYPEAKWHQYEPVGRAMARRGALLAFDRDVHAVYRMENAERILSLGADFLDCGPGQLRYAREFADRRRVSSAADSAAHAMNRLYVVESAPTGTGAKADHRLPLRAGAIRGFAQALAEQLGVSVAAGAAVPEHAARWLGPLARDLEEHRGRCLVIPGRAQPAVVHALAHAMNQTLGGVGATVYYTRPVPERAVDEIESLRELVADMDQGRVELLLILGGNPAFSAPADFEFAARLGRVPLRVHLGLYVDETARLCDWHIPETHYLEAWSDARAYDGTATIQQPLIAPLYGGKSVHELLAALGDSPERPGDELVRGTWRGSWADGPGSALPESEFEAFWKKSLHDGVVAGTAFPPLEVTLRGAALAAELARDPAAAPPADSLEIVFEPDATVYDGRFANNGWLQELPKPITKLTWDNAALMSPATAAELGVGYEPGSIGSVAWSDVIELEYGGRSLRAPVWVVPGHADGSITLHLGYGRSAAGHVGTGAGFNAYAIRSSEQPWFESGLSVRKTGERYPLACTQLHHLMHGRDLVRSATMAEYTAGSAAPGRARAEQPLETPSLYPAYEYPRYRWGMAIDLTSCTGCSACIVACQAENNIPIVGKDQVSRGREMHWLRVDSYYAGAPDNPEIYFQPVPCMHCENAPCELVCPVAATVHSDEGLNDMIYNRCVGTRYCSNNCPYKVRRFNFLQYADYKTPSLKLLYNPDVSVRSRGVMEKCTYCVQRINDARMRAEKDNRAKVERDGTWLPPIYDGEVLTACQAACPTQAIVFGDMNDPASAVARMKSQPLNYGLLAELNTRPRTTYLAALRNPNPEIERL